MVGLRFSHGVLIGFVGLKIESEICDEIDRHWTAKGHHQHRAMQARTLSERKFHHLLEHRHLNSMKHYVFYFADFGNAWDPSGSSMHVQEIWFPDGKAPDTKAWDIMKPDCRFVVAQQHPADQFLFTAGLITLAA